jgi:hypothetical protein
MVEKPKVTMPGTVEKLIQPVRPDGKEKAQVSIEGADTLYREIRIENKLRSPNGEQFRLKEGAEVEVTVEADPHAVVKAEVPNDEGNDPTYSGK